MTSIEEAIMEKSMKLNEVPIANQNKKGFQY